MSLHKSVNKIIDSEGDRIEKIRKIRDLINKNNSDQNTNRVIATDFFSDLEDFDLNNKGFERFQKQLEKTKKDAEAFNRSLSDNNRSAPFVINEINNINSLTELSSKFSDFETTSIKKAVKEREIYLKKRIEIEKVIQSINQITFGQYKENKDILKEYLNSENEEIAKAAKKRKDFFEFKPGPKTTDDDRTVDEKFADDLKFKEEQYKQYALALKNQ